MKENTCCILPENMPTKNELERVSELFKVFSDTTRIRIICALFHSELCVNNLARVVDMSQSSVSHQLRYLKQMAIVSSTRKGTHILYKLQDDHVYQIFETGYKHILHT